MPRISEEELKSIIKRFIQKKGYSPQRTYEELVRRVEEEGWYIKGTLGLPPRLRNQKLKKKVLKYSDPTLFEKLRYYLRGFDLRGSGMEEQERETPGETTAQPADSDSGSPGILGRLSRWLGGGSRNRIPRYTDAQWERIKDDVTDIADELQGFRPAASQEMRKQIEALRHGAIPRVDFSDLPGNPRQGDIQDFILPYLDEAGIPHTMRAYDRGNRFDLSPPSPAAILDWARDAERDVDVAARILGGVWGVIKPFVTVAVFFGSGILTLMSLMGGVNELMSIRGMLWPVLFVVSGIYWYFSLDMRLPYPSSWMGDAELDDEIIILIETQALGVALIVLGASFFGPPIFEPYKALIYLVIGLIGVFGIYHAEGMKDVISPENFGRAKEGVATRTSQAGDRLVSGASKVRGRMEGGARRTRLRNKRRKALNLYEKVDKPTTKLSTAIDEAERVLDEWEKHQPSHDEYERVIEDLDRAIVECKEINRGTPEGGG